MFRSIAGLTTIGGAIRTATTALLQDVTGLTICGVTLAVILCIRLLRRWHILKPYQLSAFFPVFTAALIVYWQYPHQRAHLFAALVLATIIDWLFITKRASREKVEIEGVHGWS